MTDFALFDAPPPNLYANPDNAVTLGTEFRVTSTCWAKQLRYFRASGAGEGVRRGGIYRVDAGGTTGTLLAGPVDFPAGADGGWVTVDIPPLELAPGTYRVAVLHPAPGLYVATGGYFSTGPDKVTGPVTVPTASTAAGGRQGSYTNASALAFPSSTYNAGGYYSDVIITDTNPNPPAAPVSGQRFKVRSGSAWTERDGTAKARVGSAWVPGVLKYRKNGAWVTAPTSAPSEFLRREALVYGEYMPTAADVGTYGTLTAYNAESTNTAALPGGGLIENKIIYGDIKWQGSSTLTLRNCLLVGGTNVPTGASGVVDCNASHSAPIILVDCTVRPREPRNRDCIVGHRWQAYRCDMSAGVDGMGIFTTTAGAQAEVTAEGNWVHDLTYIFPDYRNGTSGATWHSDGSHNDGVQLQGGSNVRLWGNFFDVLNSPPAATNTGPNPSKPWLSTLQQNNGAGVTIQDNTGAGIDPTVVIGKNWFRGGLSQLNAKPGISFQFPDNKFFREVARNTTGSGGTWNGYWIRIDVRATTTIAGLLTSRWVDGPYAGQLMVEPRDRGINYDA